MGSATTSAVLKDEASEKRRIPSVVEKGLSLFSEKWTGFMRAGIVAERFVFGKVGSFVHRMMPDSWLDRQFRKTFSGEAGYLETAVLFGLGDLFQMGSGPLLPASLAENETDRNVIKTIGGASNVLNAAAWYAAGSGKNAEALERLDVALSKGKNTQEKLEILQRLSQEPGLSAKVQGWFYENGGWAGSALSTVAGAADTISGYRLKNEGEFSRGVVNTGVYTAYSAMDLGIMPEEVTLKDGTEFGIRDAAGKADQLTSVMGAYAGLKYALNSKTRLGGIMQLFSLPVYLWGAELLKDINKDIAKRNDEKLAEFLHVDGNLLGNLSAEERAAAEDSMFMANIKRVLREHGLDTDAPQVVESTVGFLGHYTELNQDADVAVDLPFAEEEGANTALSQDARLQKIKALYQAEPYVLDVLWDNVDTAAEVAQVEGATRRVSASSSASDTHIVADVSEVGEKKGL